MIIVMFQTTKSVETLICNTSIFFKVLLRNKLFENLLEVIDKLNSQKLEYLPDYKMECSVKLSTVLIKSRVTRLIQFSISRVVMLIL